MTQDYEQFIASKRHTTGSFGFEPVWMPDCAQKIIGSDLKSAKSAKWHTVPDDDTMSLFDFADDDSSDDTH